MDHRASPKLDCLAGGSPVIFHNLRAEIGEIAETGWPATTDCVRNFGSIVAKLLKIAVFEANDGAASSFGGESQLNRGKDGRVISKLRVQLPTEH